MNGDNTYFGIDDSAAIARLHKLETDLVERHRLDIEAALNIGRAFLEAKALIPHDGSWGEWLESQNYHERECRRYMQMARLVDALPEDFGPVVPKFRSRGALRQLVEQFGSWVNDEGGLVLDTEKCPDDEWFLAVLGKIAESEDQTVTGPMIERWAEAIYEEINPRTFREKKPFKLPKAPPADDDINAVTRGAMGTVLDELQIIEEAGGHRDAFNDDNLEWIQSRAKNAVDSLNGFLADTHDRSEAKRLEKLSSVDGAMDDPETAVDSRPQSAGVKARRKDWKWFEDVDHFYTQLEMSIEQFVFGFNIWAPHYQQLMSKLNQEQLANLRRRADDLRRIADELERGSS